MNIQGTLPAIYDSMVADAAGVLRDNEPEDRPYYGCFSGGKDSVVIKHLAAAAGVKVDWHYNPCPDPPELLRFIRAYHPDVKWTKPKKPIAIGLAREGMPGPWYRICCSMAKEAHGRKEFKIVGVRADESPRRARDWSQVQIGAVAPILHFRDSDVWHYIHENKIDYCSLYDEGFTRLGCVGCPLASQSKRDRDFQRWPKYERWWRNICRRLWEGKEGDEGFALRQAAAGFCTWEDHWNAWRGDMRDYLRRHNAEAKVDMLCGENDLTRYMQ